jgi:kinesin family protein C1
LAAVQKTAEDKAARLAEKHKRAQLELEAKLAEQVSGAQSTAEERIKEITANLAAEQDRLQKAEAKIEKLSAEKETQVEKANAKLAKETEAVTELQAQLKSVTKEQKSLTSEKDALMSEKATLTKQLAELEKAQKSLAEESETSAAKHEKKMNKLETRLKAMEAERDVLVGERDALEVKLSEIEQAKGDVEARVQDALKEKESIAQQLADLEKAKHDMEAANEASMADIVAAQERLKASEEAVMGHEARIAGVVAQLESEQKEVERLQKELKDNSTVHKTTIESLMAAQKALERERTELKSELNALKEAESMRKDTEGNEQNKALEARLVEQTREVDAARRLVQESEQLQRQLDERQSRINELEEQALEAESMRRALHNQIQELRGNVRVFCRVRPTENEAAVKCAPDGSSLNLKRVEGKEDAAFEFDRVFDPSAKQEEIFEEVSQLVQSALDGYKVCLFSYGQTGSGKTHTMLGDGNGDMRGIIPRSVAKIVEASQKNAHKGWSYTMHASYVEIYNEQVRDLLKPGSSHSDKHSIVHKNGVTEVSGVQREVIDSVESAAALVRRASAARVVEATNMNAQSSRSHTIFMLYIVGEHASSGSELTGCLNLVDLAGSERVGRSGAEGARLKEACAINKSLSSLGDVFSALAAKQAHVPYRNSKLTYLLQPCLGGDGKTLMFVNINPENTSTEETMCSLKFASQVNAVQLGDGKGAQRRITTKLSSKVEKKGDKEKSKSDKSERKSKDKATSVIGERKRKATSSTDEPRKK